MLSTLGQQALELQLERFFTIWAWKWDIEDEDFGTHLGMCNYASYAYFDLQPLGIPLHPAHAKLTPLLESFTSRLPQELTAFALIPPYVIPPRTLRYPPALVNYVLSRIPPPPTPVSRNTSSGPAASSTTSADSDKPAPHTSTGTTKQESSADIASAVTNSLFAIPTNMPTMNLGLDPKNFKWNWPGYLTFGKSAANSKPSSIPPTPPAIAVENAANDRDGAGKHVDSEGLKPDGGKRRETLDVDTASLLEAISTESLGSYTRAASPTPSALSRSSQLGESSTQDAGESLSPVDSGKSPTQGGEDTAGEDGGAPAPSLQPLQPTTASARPPRSFLGSSVYIASPDDPLATERKRVLHLTVSDLTCVSARFSFPAARRMYRHACARHRPYTRSCTNG